jgi:hypothetical protein
MGKVGVAVILATLGAVAIHAFVARRASSAPEPAGAGEPQLPVPVVAAAPPVSATAEMLAPSLAVPSAGAPASTALAIRRPPRLAPPRASSSEPGSTLTLEVALVRQAMRALGQHDGDAALRTLDLYRARCPRPMLGQEAGLLRVRALVMVGRTEEAKALARELRDADPQGVLARRLDAILEGRTLP